MLTTGVGGQYGTATGMGCSCGPTRIGVGVKGIFIAAARVPELVRASIWSTRYCALYSSHVVLVVFSMLMKPSLKIVLSAGA